MIFNSDLTSLRVPGYILENVQPCAGLVILRICILRQVEQTAHQFKYNPLLPLKRILKHIISNYIIDKKGF